MYAIIQAGAEVIVPPGPRWTWITSPARRARKCPSPQSSSWPKTAAISSPAPVVTGAKVVAVIEGESRGPKIRVFMKKRRKGMRKSRGHRSVFTRLRVKEIVI